MIALTFADFIPHARSLEFHSPIGRDRTRSEWDPVANVFAVEERAPVGAERSVHVPAGAFMMGDGSATCGWQERPVLLTHGFRIQVVEVSNEQYRAMLQWAYDNDLITATPSAVHDNMGSPVELVDLDDPECEITFSAGNFDLREVKYALNFAYPEGYNPSDHPMKEVSWYGAASYCDWLSLRAGLTPAYDHSDWSCGPGGVPYEAEGFRLPTDAEWEYVARFDDDRIHPWGAADPKCELANFGVDGGFCIRWTTGVSTQLVGAQPELSRPIHHLAGNVYEWVNDRWTCSLGTEPAIDPAGPDSDDRRVIRGGGWYSPVRYLPAAARNNDPADFTAGDVGLRPVLTVPR